MIFECGPSGADQQVCEEIVKKWVPTATLAPSVTLDQKPKLISECGKAAVGLLADGCDRVLIIWDLYPAWRQRGEKPCRKEDRAGIFASLTTAKVDIAKVTLVCIEEELEAWLIADGRGVSAVLSTAAHPVRIRDTKNPHKIRNPKKRLNRAFKEHRGFAYIDLQHAIKIVRAIPDRAKLDRIPTFSRFFSKLS